MENIILEIKNEQKQLRYIMGDISDKLLRMEGQGYGELVSLDYKSQSMQKFLHNLVNLVNQQGHRLNQLQSDKITVERIKLGNIKFGEASKLNQTVLNNLPTIHRKPTIETFQDTVEQISINMKLQSQSIQFLYDSLKKKQQQLHHFNSKLMGFQKSQESAQSLRKAVQGNKKYTDEQIDKLLCRIKQIEGRTNKKIGQYENVTKEIQKKTLWKINQCESSLLKKVTPEYVEKALEQFQSRIHNDIRNNKNQELNQIKFNLETYKNKLDSLNKNASENEKQTKILTRKLQESLKYLETKQKIEQDKQQLQLQIKQALIKIDRLERRQDPSILDDKFTKSTVQLFEKLALHIEKIKTIQFQMQSIQSVMKSMSVDGIDPHKICTIDGDVRRLKDTSQKNENKLQSLQEQTKTKLLIFEQRVTTALSFLKSQDNYVNKEELSQNLCRIREPITEKMYQTQNLIHELNGKITKLQLFQKATKRKIKELTRGQQFNKILDMKLGVDQAETKFYAINTKIQSLEDVFNKIKKDIQSKSQFLQFLEKSINQPQEGINFIGTNKQKVFPAKCLGCGTKHNPVHENNLMMGTDGKYYKVDLNNYVTQQRQVFGVLPSQLAGYDPGSTTKKGKLPINRPVSSKSNLRPSSAKVSTPYS